MYIWNLICLRENTFFLALLYANMIGYLYNSHSHFSSFLMPMPPAQRKVSKNARYSLPYHHWEPEYKPKTLFSPLRPGGKSSGDLKNFLRREDCVI